MPELDAIGREQLVLSIIHVAAMAEVAGRLWNSFRRHAIKILDCKDGTNLGLIQSVDRLEKQYASRPFASTTLATLRPWRDAAKRLLEALPNRDAADLLVKYGRTIGY